MRKLLSTLYSTLQGGVKEGILLMALLATTNVWAYDLKHGDLYYNITSNTTVEVTYQEIWSENNYSTLTSATIPETIVYDSVTYSVTGIGIAAFSSCPSLTSVAICNSVTNIGDGAFSGCFSLTSVTIGNSVTDIGDYTFGNCPSLTSIVVESGNTIYDSRKNCNAIIETATNTLIAGCKNTIIPNSVTVIGRYAFVNCSSLTSVTIPKGVTSIEDYAFEGCISLTSLTIPNSIMSIGYLAFSGCSSLTSMVVESGNTIYDSRENCNAIIETATNTLIAGCKNTIIPNSVTIIGKGAFSGCSFLTFITIPNSVTSIRGGAFSRCSSLTSITIPDSVTSIEDYVFEECSSLTNPVYNAHCFAYMPTSFEGAYTIPGGIKQIVGGAFSRCSSLTSVIIGSSVTNIGEGAFSGCSSLSSITIGNSVTGIGGWAFNNCSSLASVIIGSSVTNIGEGAFSGCSSLDAVVCVTMIPPMLGEYVFDGGDHSTLFVPCEALSDYKAHEQWGQFANIECISSEEAETEEVVIESGTTTVVITWPTEEVADTYTIIIKKGNEVFCTLTFNADGQLLNIAFAPSRGGNNHPAQYAEQAGNGYRFMVTGLEECTHYTYNIDVKNAANKTIKSHSGEFTTESLTALPNLSTVGGEIDRQKILHDGQLLIIRNGKTYNVMGQEL